MGKIIVTEFISADGIISDPEDKMDWVNGNFSEDMGEYVNEVYESSEVLMLGANTYKIMASYWPTAQSNPDAQEGDAAFASTMNNIKKIVFSKEVLQPEWQNTTFLPDINVDQINKLKKESGRNILIAGSANVVQQLTNLNLIDEYHLLVHPVILGQGKQLFKDIQSRIALDLIEAKVFTNNVTLLKYKPL